MAPKPYLEGAGNGHHLHVSLYEGDAPVLFDASGALSGPGSGFVGGLLSTCPPSWPSPPRLPTPTSGSPPACGPRPSSPTAWTTGRPPSARLARGRQGIGDRQRRAQAVDVTSNPYLALAAVLAAGMDGVDRGLDPGEPTMVDPATLSDEERASRGIRPLPASPDEALDALEEGAALVDAIGEPSCAPTSPWRGRRQRWRKSFRPRRWRPRPRCSTEGPWGLSIRTLNVPTLDAHGRRRGVIGPLAGTAGGRHPGPPDFALLHERGCRRRTSSAARSGGR